MTHQSEEDLLVLTAQEGSHKAFNVLVERYHTMLIRFSYKLCSDQEIAKEATQEAWIKAAKNIYKLQDPRAFKSWVYRLTRWRTVDLIRKRQRDDRLLDNNIDQDNLDYVSTESGDDIEQDSNTILNQAMEKLPAIEKQIIHLFYVDDMTVAEISIVFEIPSGTVKSRLNRARQLLRKKLESNEDEY